VQTPSYGSRRSFGVSVEAGRMVMQLHIVCRCKKPEEKK